MIVKFFEVLGVFTLLIFLPHIVFSCKPKPCIFGDDDPGPNNDIFIARRISSLGSRSSSEFEVKCVKTGNDSASCKVPKRYIKTPRSMLNSRNNKKCKSSKLTKFASDALLEELRKDKYNPVRRPDRWFFKVLETRIKVDSLGICGLKDSQIEVCEYKSHGGQSQTQIGIKVKIPTVTAVVNVHALTKGFCAWDLTGKLNAKLRDVEIDAEVTAEFDAKDLSNILIADLLKFDLRWYGSPDFDLDLNNDGGILDWILEQMAGWYELFTQGISKKMNEAEEKLKNFILDKIPFCVKPDGECKNEEVISYGFCKNRYGEKAGESNQFPAGSVKDKKECLKKCKEKGEIETVYGCEYINKPKKDGSGNGKTCNYHTNKVYVGREYWSSKAPICWIFGKAK